MGARHVDMPPDYSEDPLEEGFRILARIILRKMWAERMAMAEVSALPEIQSTPNTQPV